MLSHVQYYRGDVPGFFAEAEQAIAINPNSSDTLGSLSVSFAFLGEWDRSLTLAEKAMALNPGHPGWFHLPFVSDHLRKQEYEAALSRARAVNLPGTYIGELFLTVTLAWAGRDTEAREALGRLFAAKPDFKDEANRLLKDRYKDPTLLALIWEGLRKAGLDIPDAPAAD